MLKSVSNRNIVLACLADCPADNHARPLAQFLYETIPAKANFATMNQSRQSGKANFKISDRRKDFKKGN